MDKKEKMIKRFIKRYKSFPLQLKTSLWLFLCSFIQKIVSVASTTIFTRIISTEDYGMISVFNSWSDIFVIFASLNLSVGCFNVGMTKYEENRGQWVSSLQILSLITTTVFSMLFLLAFPFFRDFVDLPVELVIIMIVTAYFSSAISLWTAKQRYVYSYAKLVKVTMGYTVLIFSVSLAAVLVSSHKGLAKIIGTAIVTAVVGAVLMADNVRGNKPAVRKDYLSFAFLYNLQMMPAFLGTSILNQIDRVMIDNMINRESAGIYSVAYSAASFIAIASASINVVYNPWLMQKVKRMDFSKTNEMGCSVSFVLLAVILAFVFCAPEIMKLLAPKEYSEAIYIIPAVAGSTFFGLIYALYCPILQYHLKVKQLSIITLISAVLNVILNYFAIKRWGYIAAGYTTYICYFIYGWGTGFCALHLMKKGGYKGKIYSLWKLGGMTLVLTASVIIIPFTYDFFIVRYIILCGMAIFLLKNMKKIMSMFLEMRRT